MHIKSPCVLAPGHPWYIRLLALIAVTATAASSLALPWSVRLAEAGPGTAAPTPSPPGALLQQLVPQCATLSEGVALPAVSCLQGIRDDIIRRAKERAAIAYDAFLRGAAGPEELEDAEAVLETLTGEDIGRTLKSTPETTPAALKLRGEDPGRRYGPLQNNFSPVEQANWYYCGPATALSILRFLGPTQSRTYNPSTGAYDEFDGNAVRDQHLLANEFWLRAAWNEGTNWGRGYMQFTLNAWRGTDWYVSSATPGAGGNLTRDMARMAIRYSVDRSYPVAENVLYAPTTYYPAGFWPGLVYKHWDVIYGFFVDEDGKEYVQIGQTYHEPYLPWTAFQAVEWDIHWAAIGTWHGIVW